MRGFLKLTLWSLAFTAGAIILALAERLPAGGPSLATYRCHQPASSPACPHPVPRAVGSPIVSCTACSARCGRFLARTKESPAEADQRRHDNEVTRHAPRRANAIGRPWPVVQTAWRCHSGSSEAMPPIAATTRLGAMWWTMWDPPCRTSSRLPATSACRRCACL
jgi:hypothetical protein